MGKQYLNNCHSLGDLLSRRAEEDRPRIFACFKDQVVTLGQLDDDSNRLANVLFKKGVRKGQKVAIISHNNLDYLVCEFAIFKVGAICVPLNCLLKSQEFSYQMHSADVVLAFVHRNYLEEFLAAQSNNNNGGMPFYIIEAVEQDQRSLTGLFLGEGEPRTLRQEVETKSDDPCCILYTSGTSGAPKGVVYENFGMLPLNGESYVQQMMDVIQLGDDEWR
jgi:fatty-acyl-CoA synthase